MAKEKSEKTSVNSGHFHTYEVDEYGNGETSFHQLNSETSHKHAIVNWVLQPAQNFCYPDCMKIYGVDGVGPHVHSFSNKENDIYKEGNNPVIKKEKVKRRNKTTITHNKTVLRNQWPFSYKRGMEIDKNIEVDEH